MPPGELGEMSVVGNTGHLSAKEKWVGAFASSVPILSLVRECDRNYIALDNVVNADKI